MRNIEIKARSLPYKNDRIRDVLSSLNSRCVGIDRQVDTYFKVPHGRLKLREGNIETWLIQYCRDNMAGPKLSNYVLSPVVNSTLLKEALTKSLGVLQVVEKYREIHYIDNIKIHLDFVVNLGHFVEIEARDETCTMDEECLRQQCKSLLEQFPITEKDLVTNSYSDMFLLKGDLNECSD